MAPTSPHNDAAAALRARLDRLRERTEEFLAAQEEAVAEAGALLAATLAAGHTVFTCGNGGSSAHADHLEAELIGRYREDREPLPGVSLSLSSATSTAIGNDYGTAEIFARPLRALGRKDDLLIAFSTSGRSPNVTGALREAGDLGMATVLVSGPGAGTDADVVLRFPGDCADAIQDGHDLILHALMDAVDPQFCGG